MSGHQAISQINSRVDSNPFLNTLNQASQFKTKERKRKQSDWRGENSIQD